ncbi:MAG: response regulator, partial [Desulfuromonadales bacterium]|nr:response regulator [Desulfuromonadales bacterium]
LIGNAVKFTEQGQVTITLRVTSSSEKVCGLLMVVCDTGIGIPAEVQNRIFESFDQGDASTTRNFGGTGLGLAITHELIQMMGGSIELDSTVGKGSEFRVQLLLPLAEKTRSSLLDFSPKLDGDTESVETRCENDFVLTGHRRRVLLAEDNPTTQELLAILLDNFGVELVMVDNGQAALDAARTASFDLIFMDCQMPLLDGLDATRTLRSEGMSMPIIALTAYARHEDEQRCRDAGMDDFLCKPFQQIELKEVMEKWLEVVCSENGNDPDGSAGTEPS